MAPTLFFTNKIESYASTDIKEKGDSIFLVKLSKNQWRRIHKAVKKTDREISIMGFIKASINKKGTPFIYVSPIDIKIYPIPDVEELPKKRGFRVSTLSKSIDHKELPRISWIDKLNEDDFIDLSPELIYLTEEEPLKSNISSICFSKYENEDLYIAVRKTSCNRYALVSGINRFIVGKCLNKNFKAYVTELSRDEFNKFVEDNRPIDKHDLMGMALKEYMEKYTR